MLNGCVVRPHKGTSSKRKPDSLKVGLRLKPTIITNEINHIDIVTYKRGKFLKLTVRYVVRVLINKQYTQNLASISLVVFHVNFYLYNPNLQLADPASP